MGGYIEAWLKVIAFTSVGHGFLVWTFTVWESTISTRSMGAKNEEPRSLPWATRSRLNFTDSALKSSPLENFTPLRSLISHTAGATFLGISTASAGTILRLGSRSTSVSQMLAARFEAGVSDWFMVSRVVGSTPWAMTIFPVGAAPAIGGASVSSRISTASVQRVIGVLLGGVVSRCRWRFG